MVDFYLAEDIDSFAIEVEQKFFASIFIQNIFLPEWILPENFLKGEHRLIFEAMQKLDDCGEDTDLVSVAKTLQADGVLEKIGGANYLADLSDTLSEEETADPGFYGSSIITFAMIRERATSCMRVKVVID